MPMSQQPTALEPAHLGDAMARWPKLLGVTALVATVALGLMIWPYWPRQASTAFQLELIALVTLALGSFSVLFMRSSGINRYRLALAWTALSLLGLLKFTVDYLWGDGHASAGAGGMMPFAAFYPVAICFHYAFLSPLHARLASVGLLIAVYALFILNAALGDATRTLGAGWLFSFCGAGLAGAISVLLMELHMRVQESARHRHRATIAEQNRKARLAEAIATVDADTGGANVQALRRTVSSCLQSGAVVQLGSVRVLPKPSREQFNHLIRCCKTEIQAWFAPGQWGVVGEGGLVFWAEDSARIAFLAHLRRVVQILEAQLPGPLARTVIDRHRELHPDDPTPPGEMFRQFIEEDLQSLRVDPAP